MLHAYPNWLGLSVAFEFHGNGIHIKADVVFVSLRLQIHGQDGLAPIRANVSQHDDHLHLEHALTASLIFHLSKTLGHHNGKQILWQRV